MSKAREILQQYWGFDKFRPRQEEIVQSALEGHDTLALLPTGGGKSICFQVPVLCGDGMGLVISPLVALMEDQVHNLRKRDISAIAINSTLSFREIDLALDNAVQGRYRFMYVSPERLQNELFLARIQRCQVSLLAVDEAHCISQWGYDFRPPYLEIAAFREHLPGVPALALTATATPQVVKDIGDKLDFPPQKHRVIRKSFRRENLYYNVLKAENKMQRALIALQKIRGTAIVYMRNRRGTVEVAEWLQQHGLSADFYHAGLSTPQRKKKQEAWLQDKTRIMVCTNAFGMGIDKPNVRLVLHLELPDSLEAYFQEAGRAGRDGHSAYSVMIVGPADTEALKARHLKTFPDIEFIRHLYQALANFLNLATGSGKHQTFRFPIGEFLSQYHLPALKTHQALRILSKEGLLELSEGYHQPSRLRIIVSRTVLYDYQLRHPQYNELIKTLVRSYGGLEIEYGRIDEELLARRMKSSTKAVRQALRKLHKSELVDYIPSSTDNTITFLEERREVRHLRIAPQNLEERYADLKRRIEAVIEFVQDDQRCRSVQLLEYFGEKHSPRCGACDVCRRQKKTGLGYDRFSELRDTINQWLAEEPHTYQRLAKRLAGQDGGEDVLRFLMDEEVLIYEDGKVKLHKP